MIIVRKIKACKQLSTVYRFFWRRARDSNPRNRFSSLHDFQSCSFDQLGQLSINIFNYVAYVLYMNSKKKSSVFSNLIEL